MLREGRLVEGTMVPWPKKFTSTFILPYYGAQNRTAVTVAGSIPVPNTLRSLQWTAVLPGRERP